MGSRWPEELQFIVNSRAVQKRTQVRIERQVCVITGTTSGVGKAAAWKFASCGGHIVMVCRNEEKARVLQSEIMESFPVDVDIILADFSNLDSVRSAADAILTNYPRIDILIHNVGTYIKKKSFTPEGLEMVFCVNHLSSFLLNSLLFERMIASAPASILYVNSEGHRFSGVDLDDLSWDRRFYTGLRSYGAAKTAQLLSVWEFHDRLQGTGVTVNAMHPGAVKSNIGSSNGKAYRWYAKHILSRALKDPVISAEALYYLAASPDMAGQSGRFYNQTIPEKPAAHALDRNYSAHVWCESRTMVGIST